ncbi:MAG TPA: carbamoyltransferase HypF [Ktedonobacteraceae bacterium]
MSSALEATIQRRRLLIQGIVQGVGFRPFVYGLALRLKLVGFVFNDSQGVTIEVEGPGALLAAFQQALREQLPPLARVDSITAETLPLCHEISFTIAPSRQGAEQQALISPDTSICADCLNELFDPTNRRYHYPFINCTNCGPRFTIVYDVPYDRAKTTMAAFPMCVECQAEYNDPGNRRFHAQPNACPTCGPQISWLSWTSTAVSSSASTTNSAAPSTAYSTAQDSTAASSSAIMGSSALAVAALRLVDGAILALKGLGGYHLACDALNVQAVQRLRQRKHREAKPFALMVLDLETAQQLCQVSAAEAQALLAHRRPIVLLSQRSADLVAPGVAPASTTLGLMLPYTPLHYLLLHSFAQLVGPGRPAALVMTSGNLSDEPIAYQDADAHQRLRSIADGMLTHNREIYMRCDDSVLRIAGGAEQFLRRSRGYAPEPLALDLPLPLLACGGHLKNTFCLGKGQRAFLSHHIGDLENLETLTSFRAGIEHFQRLFAISPAAIAYDLHPEYLATKYALASPVTRKIGVQHHHAHIASVLAEHGLSGPVIGVAADGTGFGTDGHVWGCEILRADLVSFTRLAHLAYLPLPGGEQAVRQPWRMAATYLAQAYPDSLLELPIPFVQQLDRSRWRILQQMIARGLNSPLTSSLGRLFDAVAALLNVRSETLYEGQAAIELEALARQAWREPAADSLPAPYPFAIGTQTPALLDVKPLIRALVAAIQQGQPAAEIALRFHLTIAELLAQACLHARQQTGLNVVALSGGVFQNRLLLETLKERLHTLTFQIYTNQRVPPNDGGLSLGQLAIAAAQIRSG